ncbi:EAL and HDOD domain-containing protein [Kineosporia sp. R_H_3]|uniref:EAL and HDOD domain-containing protein n=1 Tax=Kineosporia sp. R_H_3 TaxID=1961848 RepID=UPI000B4B7BC4|nr:HDOD domain-containing protein [Kineosporia sp. R_H_3]
MGARATGAPLPTAAVHVGRQPIFDETGALYGYELLFRDTAGSTAADGNGDAATTRTILAAFTAFGVSDLLGGRLGFVNLTRSFLVGELPVPFDPGGAVLEVLETVEIDDDVVAGTRRLAEQGYPIALDDFVWSSAAEPLLEIASIVKVDVLGLTWDEVMTTATRSARHGCRLLAERVEDEAMLTRCTEAGFTLFQGYHLGRPQTMTAQTLAPGHAVALQLLARLSDPATTARDVEEMLRSDPALTFRLLQIANSASNGLTRSVSSIRDAVVLVGLQTLRAWLVLITLSGIGGSADRLGAALTRARTCETVARGSATVRPDVAFTVGLLDGIAQSLGTDGEQLLERLPPLSDELAAALAGGRGPLRTLLDAVHGYETGDLAAVAASGVDPGALAEAYLGALAWTNRTASAVG